MNLNNPFVTLLFLLIALVAYKRYKKRSAHAEKQLATLSEEDLKPFFNPDDLAEENKVRLHWLISLIAVSAASAGVFFLTYMRKGGFQAFSEQLGAPVFSIIFGLAFCCLITLPWVWLSYKYAYKEKRTPWLILSLVSIPALEFYSVYRGDWAQAAEWTLLSWSLVLTFLAIKILFWINCLRLLKINSNRKTKVALALKQKHLTSSPS